MNLFSIDPGLAVWTWIVFGALFFLLRKYAFPSLLGSMKERERTIAKSVDDAERIEKRLAEVETESADRIRRANAEADEILRRIRAEGEAVRKRIVEKAEAEAGEIIERAERRIEEERHAAIESMRKELADIVVETTEKVIGDSFTAREDIDWSKELAESL